LRAHQFRSVKFHRLASFLAARLPKFANGHSAQPLYPAGTNKNARLPK